MRIQNTHSQNLAEDETMMQTKIEYHNMNMNKPTVLHELMHKTNTSSIVSILGKQKQKSKTANRNFLLFSIKVVFLHLVYNSINLGSLKLGIYKIRILKTKTFQKSS